MVRPGQAPARDEAPEPAGARADPMPAFIKPMLARAGPIPGSQEGWSAEVKWDGFRCGVYSRAGEVELVSRNGHTLTDSFPAVAGLGEQVGDENLILDGEIVAFDNDGLPSFERLQAAYHGDGAGAVLVLFDLLYHEGRKITGLPYRERRRRLEELELAGPAWQTPDRLEGDLTELLDATREQGLEGLILKRDEGIYDAGRRSGAWIKVKNVQQAEFVIGGWVPGEGTRSGRIAAILIGSWVESGGDRRSLRYMGRVGTGFGSAVADHLRKKLEESEQEDSPFESVPGGLPREVRHVRPDLVADVEYREITRDGFLRHPVFRGLRFDKGPAEADTSEGLIPGAEVDVDKGGAR